MCQQPLRSRPNAVPPRTFRWEITSEKGCAPTAGTQPVLRRPGLGPATRYGLLATVQAVPKYDSDGAFSLSPSGGSALASAAPAWRGANSSPLLKQGALFALVAERWIL